MFSPYLLTHNHRLLSFILLKSSLKSTFYLNYLYLLNAFWLAREFNSTSLWNNPLFLALPALETITEGSIISSIGSSTFFPFRLVFLFGVGGSGIQGRISQGFEGLRGRSGNLSRGRSIDRLSITFGSAFFWTGFSVFSGRSASGTYAITSWRILGLSLFNIIYSWLYNIIHAFAYFFSLFCLVCSSSFTCFAAALIAVALSITSIVITLASIILSISFLDAFFQF